MFKKISTSSLLIVLAVLVAAYLAIKFFDNKDRSKGFREELVEIDTSEVTAISMYGNDTLQIERSDNGNWLVENDLGEMVEAQNSSVQNFLNTLMTIKPSRIVTKEKNNWHEYNVDTAGTRVIVKEGNETSLDLVVGRFGFNREAMMRQQQQMQMGRQGGLQQFYTYVRLHDENEVYVADEFMGMSLSTESNNYRNRQVWQLQDTIRSVLFQYPADSGFVLDKKQDFWQINGAKVDSAATMQYVNRIKSLSASGFADQIKANDLQNPTFNVKVQADQEVDLKFYPHPDFNLVFVSSSRPAVVFADSDSTLFNQVMVSKQKFIAN